MSDTLLEVADRFKKRMDSIEKKTNDHEDRFAQLANDHEDRFAQLAKINDDRFAQFTKVKDIVVRLRKALNRGGLVEGEASEGEVGKDHEEEVGLLHEMQGREDKQAKFKSEFEKSYNESLFSMFHFLLFLYGYSGAIAVTGLVWAAIVLFQYELIDWSGESFKVPVLKPDVVMGPASYVGYIVPISISFFAGEVDDCFLCTLSSSSPVCGRRKGRLRLGEMHRERHSGGRVVVSSAREENGYAFPRVHDSPFCLKLRSSCAGHRQPFR